MKKSLSKYGRILLGAFLVIYALNQFFHFFPSGYGKMPEDARNFIDAVVMYLPMLYLFEIVIGLLLILNKWSTLLLIVLFPLSLSFLIFMFANQDFSETWPALFVGILNIILIINDREKVRCTYSGLIESPAKAYAFLPRKRFRSLAFAVLSKQDKISRQRASIEPNYFLL